MYTLGPFHVSEGKGKGINNNNVYIRRSFSRRRLKETQRQGSHYSDPCESYTTFIFLIRTEWERMSNDIYRWNWMQLPWRRGAVVNGERRMRMRSMRQRRKRGEVVWCSGAIDPWMEGMTLIPYFFPRSLFFTWKRRDHPENIRHVKHEWNHYWFTLSVIELQVITVGLPA